MHTARSTSRGGGGLASSPSTSPLGVGLDQIPLNFPPWLWAWRPLTRDQAPPGPGTPLWTEFLTHASENITLPQTSFAGGKNRSMPRVLT